MTVDIWKLDASDVAAGIRNGSFARSVSADTASLVAAFKLPFVSDASTDGMPAIAWPTRLVVICTT